MRGAWLLAMLLVVPASAAQRDVRKSTGTAELSGVVTGTAETSAPIRRVTVTLSGAEIAVDRKAVTDDAGRFTFAQLPAGRYQIVASKPAYVTTFHGSPAPGRGPGTAIALAEGQKVSVNVRLPRGAVLTGVVRDESGRPIASGQVQLSRPVVVGSETRWLNVRTEPSIITTDEAGRYRIWGLAPGDYIVRATGGPSFAGPDIRLVTAVGIESAQKDLEARSRGQQPQPSSDLPQVSFLPTFAPAVTDRALAQRFALREGQELAGADVTLLRGRSGRVAGVAVDTGGQPVANVMVALVNTRERSLWSSPGFLRPGPDGRFTLPSLGSGEWAFVGRATGAADASGVAPTLHTYTPFVMLGDDISRLSMVFGPGGVVRGRAELAGGGAVTPGARVALTQVDAIGGASSGTLAAVVTPEGTFVIDGVPPGRYRLTPSALGPQAALSALVGEHDGLDVPFDVAAGQAVDVKLVVTPKPTTLSGLLTDQLGRPAPEFSVVVFSTDRAHWLAAPRRLTGLVRLGSDGRFRIVGLPPGSYHLAAVVDAEPAQLSDPSFLEQLAAAALTITLADGEQKTQDIKLAGG